MYLKHSCTHIHALCVTLILSYCFSLLLKSVEARSFLHRQIWSNIKLYQNILQFSCLLSDSKLRHLALDSLLNRYIMLGLQCAGPDGCLKRIKAVSTFSNIIRYEDPKCCLSHGLFKKVLTFLIGMNIAGGMHSCLYLIY